MRGMVKGSAVVLLLAAANCRHTEPPARPPEAPPAPSSSATPSVGPLTRQPGQRCPKTENRVRVVSADFKDLSQ
jgi:hypothetical protein